jgi:hypothetical protein
MVLLFDHDALAVNVETDPLVSPTRGAIVKLDSPDFLRDAISGHCLLISHKRDPRTPKEFFKLPTKSFNFALSPQIFRGPKARSGKEEVEAGE